MSTKETTKVDEQVEEAAAPADDTTEEAVEEPAAEAEVAETQEEETTEPVAPEPKAPTLITADRKKLIEALRTVGRAVTTRSSLPILGHVCFYSVDGVFYVEATDLEKSVRVPVPAFFANAGSDCTAPYKSLLDALSAITNSIIEIEVTDGVNWEIKAGVDSYFIEGLPAEEFPRTSPLNEVAKVSIPADTLRRVLKRMLPCVSGDESRRVLNGVIFHFKDGVFEVASTDTHRLAFYESTTIQATEAFDAIIPATTLYDVNLFLGKSNDDVVFTFGDTTASIEIAETSVRTRLIEGQYPNYRRILPSEYSRRVIVSSEAMVAAMKKTSTISKENANRVTLEFKDKMVVLSSAESQARFKTRVDAVLEGDETMMAFNYRYLGELFNAIDSKAVEIQLTGALNPAALVPMGSFEDGRFMYILMPMQVDIPEKQPVPAPAPIQAEEEKVPAEAAA